MQTKASCFGTVKFFGFGSDVKQEAPYVRVDHTTRMGTIWTLLVKYWNMPPPKLIISVIGGAENFAMNRQLRSSFKRSLVSAATSAGAWVISAGTQDGVAGLVGEAFREYVPSTFDHKPVVLGIANWGVIDKKRTLDSYNGEGRFPAAYTASPAWGRSSGKVPLEHNHTHFLLVDNGTERKFNTELNFRSNLERYLADSLTRSQDDQVPVVLVVLEGGEDTMLRVAEAVEKGTPAVVIAGTGHAADLIATAYSTAKTRSERVTLGKTSVEQMCRTLNWPMSAAITPSTDAVSGEMSKSVEYLNRILKQKALVTVCTPHDAGEPIDIDCVILEALAKDTKCNPVSQLRLALDWNRSDIAAKHIVDIANSGKRKDVELEHNMMFTALMQNQVDFVKLFIDSGFDLSKFLTVSRLNQLYLTMFRDGSVATVDLFRHLMEHVQSFRAKLRRPRPETYSLTNVGKAINFLLGVKTSSMYDENKEKFDYPERELMYWALLFNRQELANFLWSHCRDPLGAALTAATLLTALARHANNDEKVHLWNDLKINAREFGELAVGVLNECHINDTLLAQRLLVRPLDTWSKKTPLMIARVGKQMSFMEHACTQAKLNRLWMGNMSVNTSVWKIIFLLLPFIKFSSSEKGDDSPRRVKWRVSTKLLDGRHASFTQAAIHFVSAPVTKFYFHTVSFVMFMALFSYIVMTNLRPTSEAGSPAVSEYVLWAWGVTLVIEEVRQAYSTGSDYLHSSWNRFDLLGYSTLTLAVILRYTVPDSNFAVARMTYCVALIVFYMRFMQVFFIEKHIGPTVIAMRRMVTDVMFFMCILLVFMVSYGTVVQALRYPNSLLSWSLLSNVIYHPFWFIHGQFNQDEMEGNVGACYRGEAVLSTSHGLPRCPETSMLLMPLSGLYLVVANVLLLNLLIAMFSNTFQTVHGKSETLWRYYLYDLIYEYFDKPVLPPPLNVFSHLYTVLQLAVSRLSHTCTDKPGPDSCDNAFCRHFSPSINDELTKFERQSTEKYLLKKRQLCNERIDTKVQSTRERIDNMAADLEDVKERMKSQNNLLRTMLEQCEPTVNH